MSSPSLHSVLIAHPERQHSHQFALALNQAGLLGLYVHGSALPADVTTKVPAQRRHYVRWFQPLRRGLPLILPRKFQVRMFNAMLRYYDWALARRLPVKNCNATIGYERSSLHVFTAAKKLSMPCILDAASVHHKMQTKWVPGANDAVLSSVKDQEIALADLIITCSTLARQSYIDAGVPAEKITTVSLGVNTSLFRPEKQQDDADSSAIRFCFAGRMIRLKGGDLLATACGKLEQDGLKFNLEIAAPKIGAEPDIVKNIERHAELTGRVAHDELYKFYSRSDVFVFPSRFESFGLVVTEALACGLPVIVTENVGAKDMIEEGVNGWVIPADDADALAERMAWCAANPQAVRAMSKAARKSAEARSWDAYRKDVAGVVCKFLDERAAESAKS